MGQRYNHISHCWERFIYGRGTNEVKESCQEEKENKHNSEEVPSWHAILNIPQGWLMVTPWLYTCVSSSVGWNRPCLQEKAACQWAVFPPISCGAWATSGSASVKKWTMSTNDPFTEDLFLFPTHVRGNHWILLVVKHTEMSVTVMDSHHRMCPAVEGRLVVHFI